MSYLEIVCGKSISTIRLKPYAIDVKSPMDAIHWFLDGKEDIRSPYYPEDVATEFQVQGLELDWACITWDVDFDILQTVGNAFHLSAAAGITLIKPKGNHILRMLIS